MRSKSAVSAAAAVIMILGSAMASFGQLPTLGNGQGVPPLPRLWDEGLGNWLSLGLGTPGLVLAFSRLRERSVVTLRAGAYAWSEAFSGADMSATVGLPLTRGRFFASVGGGLGLMIGELNPDARTKAYAALAADLQLSLRLNKKLAVGVYAPFNLGLHKTIGGIFVCLQYGRFEI